MFHHPQIKSRFEPPPLDTNVTGEAWIEYAGEGTNQITVLHVKADNHYSLGYHHGKLLGPQVAAGVEDVLSGAENLIPKQARRVFNKRGTPHVGQSGLDKNLAQVKKCAPQ